MNKDQAVSIVVPTLNEVDSIPSLLARIDASMKIVNVPYEVIIVDDNSSDNTVTVASNLSGLYPVRIEPKRGKRGKAYSLLEGFKYAQYPLVAMIDADLQYPPEALVPMHKLLTQTSADLIVTNRVSHNVSPLRKLSTKIFNLLFAKLLFGINFDTQSGLKLFKKNILTSFKMAPSPWSFDLEFIVRSIEHNYKIVSQDIPFDERLHGQTKVSLLSTTIELAKASLSLRWRTSRTRIRAGARANNRFLEKAFLMAVITLIGAVTALSFPSSVNALTVTATPNTSSLTGSIFNDIHDFLTPGSSSSSQTQPSQSNNPTNTPSSASTGATSTDSGNNGTGADAPTSNGATPTAALGTSDKSTTAKGSTSSVTTENVSINNGSLAPATATNKKSSIYDTGYPYYKLSAETTNRYKYGAQIAFTAGVVCLLAIILMLGTRAITGSTKKLLTRS